MAKQALVVDDSSTMRDMVAVTLRDIGYEVGTAEDGEDALSKCGAEQAYDVIVTDINMPKMDGIALIKKLRGSDGYKHIPILVLTTEGGDDLKTKGREAGATGWIVKPFDPQVLVNAVTKICGG